MGLVHMLFPLFLRLIVQNWHVVIKDAELVNGCIRCIVVGTLCLTIWLVNEYFELKREPQRV
jgi:vacuolar-type H+-ATPase subunit I/STV1